MDQDSAFKADFLFVYMNRKTILISMILATLVAVLTFYNGNYFSKESITISSEVNENTFENKEIIKSEEKLKKISLKSESTEKATLLVGGKPFPISVSENTTLYEAMNELRNGNTLFFKDKYFSGIGYFIEEIGGIKNENGAYWSLYVNGKESQIGVSALVPKVGDLIEWRYEKR